MRIFGLVGEDIRVSLAEIGLLNKSKKNIKNVSLYRGFPDYFPFPFLISYFTWVEEVIYT